jgi:hypothetical protein
MPIPGLDPDRGPTLQSIYGSDGWNRYQPLPPQAVLDPICRENESRPPSGSP